MRDLPYFKFWCQKVLPLVYDDSLSYYEILCKVVNYINNLIDTDKDIFEDINEIKNELTEVQNWINNFDSNADTILRELIEKYISRGVIFGLTNDGYFCAYIPESWSYIEFDTIEDYDNPLYGHLVLKYD